MMKLANSLFALVAFSVPMVACSAADDMLDGDNDAEHESEDLGTDEGALSSAVSCDRERQPMYSGGRNIGNTDVVKIGGKRVTIKTGHAFLKLQKAAAARGIDVWINSGFRTMSEQTYFWNCFQNGNCNNGNRAARPGYSNHQNGRALDMSTSNRSALNRLIDQLDLDWRLTVPGEPWHYEYFGPTVTGPCDGNGGDDDDDDDTTPATGCYSPTLAKRVEDKVCVQGAAAGVWFQCKAGSWERGVNGNTGPFGECTSKHALND